jgi:HK97 gp10 family phage protein
MIVGVDKLKRKLDKIASISLEKPTQKAISLVQESAKSNVAVDSGELRESIYTDVQTEGERVIGTCYTNKEYAAFVEFGTGQKGQENHNGISPEVPVAYRQTPWWIHESQIDKQTAEKYHWFYIDTPEGRFYQCTGQPAKPYLYPALKNNEDNIREIYSEYITEEIGE